METEEGINDQFCDFMYRRCGIPFNIWEKDDEDAKKGSYAFTSLVGYRKKNLLKFFPSKIPQCQPPARASEVQQLWKVI